MENESEAPLRKLPVDLSAVAEIAEEREQFDEDARVGYVDKETGEVHILARSVFRALEDEEEMENLEEWERDEVEVAARIWDDSTGRFEEIERWESRDDYDLMEEFADRTQDPELRQELFEALNGPKPFRSFKEVLYGWPQAREAWFTFQEHTHRDWARKWLNTLGIDPTDTSSYQPPPVPERW